MKINHKILFITTIIIFSSMFAISLINILMFNKNYSESLFNGTKGLANSLEAIVLELLDLGLDIEQMSGMNDKCKNIVDKNSYITYCMITDNKGKVLHHNDKSMINVIFEDDVMKKILLERKYLIQKYHRRIDNKDYYDVSLPLFNDKKVYIGSIRVGFLTDIISSKITGSLFITILNIFMFFIISIFLINYFLNQTITKHIKNIGLVINKIANGDLTEIKIYNSKDEIGQLYKDVDFLRINIEELLSKIRESIGIISASIFDLTSSSQQIAAISNEQAATVKEIVSTMEDSTKLSKANDQKINEIVNLSFQNKNYVEDGFRLVKENLNKVQEIKETNQKTIEGIKFLGDQIDSIWEIVNIINSIADQTKIIAFNAELEASAAGESGKNFKIVASEIRRLADNTVASTKEIKAKISEIQKSSDTLIIASENSSEKVKQGWELTNQLESLFKKILNSSEITAESSKKISLAVNQQVISSEQIFLSLKQISESIDNFVNATRSMTSSSNKLKELTDIFNTEIGKYKIKLIENKKI